MHKTAKYLKEIDGLFFVNIYKPFLNFLMNDFLSLLPESHLRGDMYILQLYELIA
jgi:hypothetical protein